jgi:mannose-6-phosphate isomerase-like protein (cupin superfamily)
MTQEQDAFHLAGEERMRAFQYERPESDDVKTIAWLLKDPQVTVAVQIVKNGGENNLHYHTNASQVYFVLAGGVRFNGVADSVISELGPQQGIFIPAGARYWFEKTGSEDLQMLQIVSRSGGKSERLDIQPKKEWMDGRTLGPNLDADEASA